jgi:aminoglycoside phosphotransferase (APT) family kinase protein
MQAAADSEFDPDDKPALRVALADRLSSRFGSIQVVEGPDRYGSGLDTYVYAIRLQGDLPPEWLQPLVLRVYPTAEQAAKAEREASAQTFAADHGIAAPRPRLVETRWEPFGLPFMIMERVSGTPLIERFKNPLAIGRSVRAMARLQAQLHSVPADGCPLAYDGPLVDRLIAPAKEQVERFRLPGLAAPLRWIEDNSEIVRKEDPAFVHNDFHPLNIVADGDHLTLLDWPDATLGDRHCDVARTLALFWLAPPLESSVLTRTVLGVLRRYIVPAYARAYRKRLPLDDRRLRYWQALHAFKAWTQIAVMRSEGEKAIGARAGVLSQIPPALLPALKTYFYERTR